MKSVLSTMSHRGLVRQGGESLLFWCPCILSTHMLPTLSGAANTSPGCSGEKNQKNKIAKLAWHFCPNELKTPCLNKVSARSSVSPFPVLFWLDNKVLVNSQAFSLSVCPYPWELFPGALAQHVSPSPWRPLHIPEREAGLGFTLPTRWLRSS